MFPSYRNQSVDLQSKSTNWFLYERKLRVKQNQSERLFLDGDTGIDLKRCIFQGITKESYLQ